MNKQELIAAIAEKAEMEKDDAKKALNAFIEVVGDELKKGEKIQIIAIRRLARRWRSRLPEIRSSRQERH